MLIHMFNIKPGTSTESIQLHSLYFQQLLFLGT